MMIRKSEEFWAACDRVKVGDFIKRGWEVRGVVHIGANDGYEVEWYRKLGLEVLCFEPMKAAIERFEAKYTMEDLRTVALGNFDGIAIINVVDLGGQWEGAGGGSSLLPLMDGVKSNADRVDVYRWATLIDEEKVVDPTKYDCCVIDVQGMELDVLRGMDEHIQRFNFFIIECSSKIQYKGGATGEEVAAFMQRNGFVAITPMQIHDDVLFVKRELVDQVHVSEVGTWPNVPKGTRLNCGSGQRKFDTALGWINIDSNPRWTPDVVTDWNDLSMFEDGSMDVVVSHHSIEHVGCGEATGFIREAHRVLKPGGSLLVFVPDMKALAQRWILGELTDQIYFTNVYGAYMGDEADRHRWGYSRQGLVDYLKVGAGVRWADVHSFNFRPIAGADIANDFWIIGMECVR